MDFTAGFSNLSGMFRKLLGGTPAVEILEPEELSEGTPSAQAKQNIISVISDIGEYLKTVKEDHPNIDSITSMPGNGYLAVTMANKDNSVRQVTAYTLDSKGDTISVTKENSIIRKNSKDDFSEEQTSDVLKPHGRNLDERVATEKRIDILIEDVSEQFGVDQVALVAYVKGGVIIEGRCLPAHEALTAD